MASVELWLIWIWAIVVVVVGVALLASVLWGCTLARVDLSFDQWISYAWPTPGDRVLGKEWTSTPKVAIVLVHGLFGRPFQLRTLLNNLYNEDKEYQVISIDYLHSSETLRCVDIQCDALIRKLRELQSTCLHDTKLILGGLELGGVLVRRVATKIPNVVGWFSLDAPHKGGLLALPPFYGGCEIESITANRPPYLCIDKGISDDVVEGDLAASAHLPVLLMGCEGHRSPLWSALMFKDRKALTRLTVENYVPSCYGNMEWYNEQATAQIIQKWIRAEILTATDKAGNAPPPCTKTDAPECKA